MVFINVFETVVLEKRTASQTPEVSPEAAKEYTACPQPAEAASTIFPARPHSLLELEPDCDLAVARVVRLSGDFAEIGVPRNESGVRKRTELVRLKNSARSSSFMPNAVHHCPSQTIPSTAIPAPRGCVFGVSFIPE